MILLLSIFVVALRLITVESFQDTGCWARQNPPLSECIFSTPVSGRPEQEISYTIRANFSQVCCQALQCTTFSCSLTREYCGHARVWQIVGLPWEVVGMNVNPMMRCRGAQVETFYSYRFDIHMP